MTSPTLEYWLQNHRRESYRSTFGVNLTHSANCKEMCKLSSALASFAVGLQGFVVKIEARDGFDFVMPFTTRVCGLGRLSDIRYRSSDEPFLARRYGLQYK